MSLKTNREQLVMTAVQGGVAAAHQWAPFEVGSQGEIIAWPSTGGITYNVKVGDSVFGWAGEHIEPGVSATLEHKNRKCEAGFQFLSCCGNEVRVISGEAKGAKGRVLGHHGGVEHLMLQFDDATLDKLTCDDKFLVRGYGQGLRLIDHPGVHIFNIDPDLFDKWGLKETADGKIEVPVNVIVPGHAMGSGIGALSVTTGDYDILCQDEETVKEHGLDRLRFGDFVAVIDHDNRYGRTYRKGALTIGMVIHSDSPLGGHGPGMMTLMSATGGELVPVLSDDANMGVVLGIGRFSEVQGA
ncbi:MAG: DUF4438 domain-containing protein [Zetaproteobacteria bacterium CG12_big_fil_rev_8_21_14_0_65_55_1124]|nr:MAG: DUF4438 domain-containing protein [Zetaproteobacteria bacterium CG1_02_55_237]PIS19009.1 MAG: DUF4438 domain-containing protein [Zetaproteobacteria bacterium CG08_land_8_20_14_0_20_55_17]PIW41929.1 MAG: DUF4438 domain-containing protein [Zetaproteobacteria bacterium CG12_big_fil_rev_8_21_14_0_65_55_1124]PIY53547.1 MAG: DUF4438 domain-containing protein [Zetaproteobacteria bacterium CG_4_10_14_0_8_um_filter_55_43]PIZ37417.1 MAG: DUF4438 domain-containing protein [Zetaproteobacteria bacte